MASSWQQWHHWSGAAQQWQSSQWQAGGWQAATQVKFPAGQFVAARWPVTIAHYPAKGEPGSWQAMQEIARDMDCVIKLGGRREKKRKARHVARLTVKGANAED